jgi:hypothetical protein
MTTNDTESASPPSLAGSQTTELARRRQEGSFRPSTTIEALVLQVIGGWEQLKATVNMYRFLEAGPDSEWPGETNLPAAMNKLAKEYRIRWPHDRFAAKVNHANNIRQRFAHFLYVSSILGDEPPNRTLYFTRLGGAGESFKAKRGALGLRWRDAEWAQQDRHEDSITEQELRETLAELKWLIDCCRALRRLAGILANSPHLPDDHPINTAGWWIPWRTDEEPLLLLRDLRLDEDEVEPAATGGSWRRALSVLGAWATGRRAAR